MNTLYTLLALAIVVNGLSVCTCVYFMYKATIRISAYKRSNEPWEAIALVNAEKKEEENGSEQTQNEDFATIPSEFDFNSLRNQL